MNLKIKSVFIAMLLFCSLGVQAQNVVTIKGTVTSQLDGQPIMGANIIAVGTQKGTSTDFDGNYQIEVKTGEILEFSYLGFGTKRTPYASQDNN